jgi:hypothetical protein
MVELKKYRVINSQLVESLAQQLQLPIGVEVTTEGEANAGVKLIGGRRKRSAKNPAMQSNDPRLIPFIVGALRESGQLNIYRPARADDFWNGEYSGWYVHEQNVLATPVHIPLAGRLEGLSVPEALTVWVSDPLDDAGEPEDEWDFLGSFLFIVQELGQGLNWPTSTFISGMSALRMIVDFIVGQEPFGYRPIMEHIQSEGDDFGRFNPQHPIEKLAAVGGKPGRPRRIDTVYKIEYMTNEQSAPLSGKVVRVNDILAYPLYIAE